MLKILFWVVAAAEKVSSQNDHLHSQHGKPGEAVYIYIYIYFFYFKATKFFSVSFKQSLISVLGLISSSCVLTFHTQKQFFTKM